MNLASSSNLQQRPVHPAATQHAKHVVVSGGDANIAQLFCQVDWRGDGFDALITDASQAWRIQGAEAPPLGEHSLQPQQYLAACRDALCARKPQRLYTYRADLDPNTKVLHLRVQFEWQPGEWVVISLALQHVRDHSSALADMLRLLTDGYATLLDQVGSLDQAHTQLETQLQATQAALTQERQANTAKEQELYVKFSLLLNSKKAKLRELQQQCQDQQDKIATLEEQLAGTANVEDLDDTDLDRAEDAGSVELIGHSPQDNDATMVDKPKHSSVAATAASKQKQRGMQLQPATGTTAAAAQLSAMEVDALPGQQPQASTQRTGNLGMRDTLVMPELSAYRAGVLAPAAVQPDNTTLPNASLDTEAAFAAATLPPSCMSDLGGSATLPIASEALQTTEQTSPPAAANKVAAQAAHTQAQQHAAAMQVDVAADDDELDLGL